MTSSTPSTPRRSVRGGITPRKLYTPSDKIDEDDLTELEDNNDKENDEPDYNVQQDIESQLDDDDESLAPSSEANYDLTTNHQPKKVKKEKDDGTGVRCNECHQEFFNCHSMVVHMRSHSQDEPYRCRWSECTYESMEQNQLLKHIRGRHFDAGKSTTKKKVDKYLPGDAYFFMEPPKRLRYEKVVATVATTSKKTNFKPIKNRYDDGEEPLAIRKSKRNASRGKTYHKFFDTKLNFADDDEDDESVVVISDDEEVVVMESDSESEKEQEEPVESDDGENSKNDSNDTEVGSDPEHDFTSQEVLNPRKQPKKSRKRRRVCITKSDSSDSDSDSDYKR